MSKKAALIKILVKNPGITLPEIKKLSSLTDPGRQLRKLVTNGDVVNDGGHYQMVNVPAATKPAKSAKSASGTVAQRVQKALDEQPSRPTAILAVLAGGPMSQVAMEDEFRPSGKSIHSTLEQMMDAGFIFYAAENLNDDLILTPPGKARLEKLGHTPG